MNMKKNLFLLMAMLTVFGTANAETADAQRLLEGEKTPYVLRVGAYLYFTCRSEVLNVGDTFIPEGATASSSTTGPIQQMWSGDEVVGDHSAPWDDWSVRNSVYMVNIESSFQEARPKRGSFWFWQIKALRINGLEYLNTSEMTHMNFMFNLGSNITSLDLSHFDTSKVTTMEFMFQNCKFTSLDLSHFDTGNVTDMSFMFRGCSKLRSLNLSGWDTGKVTTMFGMFYDCSLLNAVDVSHFNTQNVTSMGAMFYGCERLPAIDVSHFSTGQVTTMQKMFYNCKRVNTLDVSGWDTKNVENMESLFDGCEYLNGIDVSGWNTGCVVNMSRLFRGCSSLTNLGVSGWDTHSAAHMGWMFYGCSNITQLNLSGWNTSQVWNMASMFAYCNKLGRLDIGGWDTNQVEYMADMFRSCSVLPSLDVSHFNTSRAAEMTNMFRGCSALTTLDVTSFNTSKVEEMSGMFADCPALTTLDVSGFDVSRINDFSDLFKNCKLLAAIDVSQWNNAIATKMNAMFMGCEQVTTLDLSQFYTSNVSNMGEMFSGCTRLQGVYVNNLWSTGNVTASTNMFAGCEAITGQDGTTYDSSQTDKGCAHYATGGYLRHADDIDLGPQPYVIWDGNTSTLYFIYSEQLLKAGSTFTPQGADAPATITNIWYGDAAIMPTVNSSGFYYRPIAVPCWNEYLYYDAQKVVFEPSFAVVKPTSTAGWFRYFSIEQFDGLNYLNTSEVTDMQSMFLSCSNLKGLDLSHFDTRMVTDMNGMFAGCSLIESLDVSHFNTGLVTNMSGMFDYCSALQHLDIANFDTGCVTDISYMFNGCEALADLNVRMFQTGNVNYMNSMFAGCKQLQTLDLSTWDTDCVTDMSDMFNGDQAMQAIYVGDAWSTEAVTESEYMFYGCQSIVGEDGTTYETPIEVNYAVEDQTPINVTKAHYGVGGYLRYKHTLYTITIPASGTGTFSAAENVTLPEGLTAATCTEFDGAAGTIQATTLTQSVIPAATGVLVKGTPGETYTLYVTDDEAAPVADNALVAVTIPTHVAPTDGDYTHFMLKNGTFIRIAEADESAKMPANKAYLSLPTAMLDTGSGASLTIVWDETTGISHTQAGTDGGEQVKCYNLQGQRVAKPAKGIYVINRRKVIVK